MLHASEIADCKDIRKKNGVSFPTAYSCVGSELQYTSGSSLLLLVHFLVIIFGVFFYSACNLRCCCGVGKEFLYEQIQYFLL